LPFAFAVAAILFALNNIATFSEDILVPPPGATGAVITSHGWTSSQFPEGRKEFTGLDSVGINEEIVSFDAANRTVLAHLSLAFKDSLVDHLLWINASRTKLFPLSQVPHHVWAQLPVGIQLDRCLGDLVTAQTCDVPIATIPLGQLVRSDGGSAAPHGSSVHAPVTVPVVGWPDRFPSDRYALFISPRITLPDRVVLATRAGAFDRYWNTAPTKVTLAAPGLGDRTLTAYESPITGALAIYAFIGRSLTYRVTVYGLALLPLLLGVAVVHASAHQAALKRTSSPEFDLGLIAALIGTMLAILPLRAVLVPTDLSVTGLTILDYILVLDLLFIATFVFFQYARFVTKRPVPGPAEPPQSPAASIEPEPK
jgi:hypothetical protein